MSYIIDFVESTTTGDIMSYFATNGITQDQYYSNLGRTYLVTSPTPPPEDPIVQYIIDNTSVEITPLVAEYKTINTEDEYSWWKLASVNVQDFSSTSLTHYLNQTPVDVYVFDSGYYSSHSEFSGLTIDEIFTYDGNYTDTSGHGTAIASLIGGNNLSLAKTNLKIVKLFGSTTTYLSDLLGALDAVISDAATSIYPKIANMSWVIHKNLYIESKIKKLYDSDILVVCAAGNTTTDISNLTPASMDGAITVGAYDEDFSPIDFRNYTGSIISTTQGLTNSGLYEVFAPGQNIVVADTSGEYGLAGGTSIATAIHTSAVAHTLGSIYSVNYGLDSRIDYSTSRSLAKFVNASNFGLLDITSAWFSIVRNSTTIMRSQVASPDDIYVLGIKHITLIDGSSFAIKLFTTIALDNYSIFSGSLPSGVTLDDGWLHGSVVLSGSSPETFNVTLSLELNGNSVPYLVDYTIVVNPS